MFKVLLLLFIISYGQLAWISAKSACGFMDDRELPLKEVEYFSFSSSAKAIVGYRKRRISQLQCGYKRVDLCKDYAVDNVKCKNLRYKTDLYPSWDCDFKFKVSNVSVYSYEVKYSDHTYVSNEKTTYCYVKDSAYLDYVLDYYVPKPKPEPTGFNWTWIIVVGSILAIVGILVVLVMFTEIGRNTFNSFKSG